MLHDYAIYGIKKPFDPPTQVTIRMISIVGKVFVRVLNERVNVWTMDKVMDEQAGYRAGRGCVDQTWKRLMIV